MTNTALIPMPQHRVENAFNKAADDAFRFATLKEKQKNQNETREERKEELGGKISPTWVFMSIIGLLAAIGFGIYGAFNAQGAIASIVDPMGTGVISPMILMIIGVSISMVGMIFGHLIFEGLSEGFSQDPYTGARRPTSKLWLSVVGLIGAVFYVSYQYVLVKSAGNNAGITSDSGLSYMPYVVVGVAILELLIGAFILHRAFSYLLFFGICILLLRTIRKMNAAAKSTNVDYRRYLSFIDVYNRENGERTIQAEGNVNIREAIAHYSGINLPENGSVVGNEVPIQQPGTLINDTPAVQPTTSIPEEINTRHTDKNQVNNFLDDAVDDNLTV